MPKHGVIKSEASSDFVPHWESIHILALIHSTTVNIL